jgi:predicted ATPase
MDLLNDFRGRDAELQLLGARLREAAAGQTGIALIIGPPGVGRSSLLATFARDLAWKELRVRAVLLRASDSDRYDPVGQAARELRGRVRREVRRRLVGSDVSAETRERAIVVEWLAAIPIVGNLLAAIVETVLRVRTLRSAATRDRDVLYDAARRRTLLLLVDDVHRADARGLRELGSFMRDAPDGSRILLVVTTIDAPRAVACLESITRGFPPERVTSMTLSPVASDDDVEPDATTDDATLPPSVSALLAAASGIGTRFDSLSLANVVRREELDVEDDLAVAVRAGVIVSEGEVLHESGEAASAYRFVTRTTAASEA